MANGVGAILTLIDRGFWTDFPVESCNPNTVLLVTTAVGVPEIFPVDGFSVSPVGNAADPGAKFQV
jgi:hypothetical protein